MTAEHREMDKEENNLLVEVVCGRWMFGVIMEDDGGVRSGQRRQGEAGQHKGM